MEQSASRLYTFGDFTLDPGRLRLLCSGEHVALRPKAFDTLRYLIEHRGRVVTKDELLHALWPKVVVTEDSLVKCVQEARIALDDDRHRYIRTVPRRGYLFEAPVTVVAPAVAETRTSANAANHAIEGTSYRGRVSGVRSTAYATASALLLAVVVGFAAYRLVIDPYRARSATPPVPAVQSVAVLPFVTIGPEPTDDYFSDGISEELMNVLANVPGLHVPSRTSSFTFKGTKADVRTIASALNVDHVLEGSVRRVDTRVRITAQLIDVSTDSHLWSATFDRELIDVFAIQDEIARNVAAALRIELLGADLADPSGSRTDDIEAYDAYLRATHYRRMQRLEDNPRVRQSFLRAIELDPGYSAAHAGLAIALLTAERNGIMERGTALAEAEHAIDRALELDPDLALGYVARGLLERSVGDYAQAAADLQQAIDLQPNLADAYFQRMFALGALGRFAEARASLERALELDPLNGFYNRWMGNVQLALGNPAKARIYDERAVEFEPSQANAYAGLGDIAIATGQVDEALAWYLKGLERDPGHAHITALAGELYLSLGDADLAHIWFQKAADMYQTDSVSRFFRNFMPVDAPPADPAALLELLHALPTSHFTALGTRLFRKAALQTRDIDGIESFCRQYWPELFEPQPRVNANNFAAATDVAWLHLARGQRDRAAVLLDRVHEVLRDPEQRSIEPPEWSFAMVEVEALALQGRKTEALAALRRVVDAGWRVEWWQVESDPTLVSINGEPEFLAIIAEVKAALAVQLERVRAAGHDGR
jgi:TolB-like protein/DNA-binding winged helix-turn-helix (wHTH) protein/Tfp pilus assembly protein PilF